MAASRNFGMTLNGSDQLSGPRGPFPRLPPNFEPEQFTISSDFARVLLAVPERSQR